MGEIKGVERDDRIWFQPVDPKGLPIHLPQDGYRMYLIYKAHQGQTNDDLFNHYGQHFACASSTISINHFNISCEKVHKN